MLQKEAIIDSQALEHNLAYFRNKLAHRKLVACVKANAYGHGFYAVMPVLAKADACYVHSWDAAVSLRRDYSEINVILAGFLGNKHSLQHMASENISWVVFCQEQLDLMRTSEFTGETLDIWLKIDTGMNRLGFSVNEAEAVVQELELIPWVREIIIMTHYACAAESKHPLHQQQINRFKDLAARFPYHQTSAGGTAMALQQDQSLGDWVRVGVGLYGVSPFLDSIGKQYGLRPVMHLRAKIISVKSCYQGDNVGYGATWSCSKNKSRLAVIAIGYGDGYTRAIACGAPVYVNGSIAKVVGVISMDTTVIELADDAVVAVGDWAELWGANLAVETVASYAGTIGYELLTMIGRRVKRTMVVGYE